MKLRNKNTNTEGEGHIIFTKDGIEISYQVYSDENGHCGLKCKCRTLKDLADNFEIVEETSAEPLIKDEKIRKAVRAWADGNNIESVHHDAFWRGFRRDNSSITVWEELPLEDNKVYTIAELCGEEEE